MEQKSGREIQAELSRPFAPEDLEWRLQVTTKDKTRGLAVPYVTNRAIQERLDEVVGPDNWYNDYKPWHGVGKKEAQICGISIYFKDRGFITKWDGAEDSDIEPVKGGLSDSMKRAAVQWGIGRILYKMDTVWVGIEERGGSYVIRASERVTLDKAYLAMLQKLGQVPAPAGGTQSQLTPKLDNSALIAEESPDGSRKTGTSTASAAGEIQPSLIPSANNNGDEKTTEFPCSPSFDYIVRNVRVQNGMSGSSTLVVLETPDGKRINTFARGDHSMLRPDTMLVDVKLTLKQQDTVVFYVLEEYRLVPEDDQAA